MDICDTAGDEGWGVFHQNYLKQTQGMIIVYDITRRESFDNVSFFLYLRLENGLSIYFGDFLNVSLDSVQTSDYLEADLLFE